MEKKLSLCVVCICAFSLSTISILYFHYLSFFSLRLCLYVFFCSIADALYPYYIQSCECEAWAYTKLVMFASHCARLAHNKKIITIISIISCNAIELRRHNGIGKIYWWWGINNEVEKKEEQRNTTKEREMLECRIQKPM